MMTNREVNAILKRIKDAKSYWKNYGQKEDISDDKKLLAKDSYEAVDDLIDKMCSYTCAVFDDKLKGFIRIDDNLEVKDRQEKIQEIERTRKLRHDALITQIKMVDKMCRMEGVDEIYGELPKEYRENVSGLMGDENREKPGVVETRHAIAKWTFDFVLSCSVGMYLDLGELDFENNPDDFRAISSKIKGEKKMQKDIKEMTD